MNPALIAELLRGGLAALSFVRQWRANASTDELKKFVDAIHVAGGTVDLAAVDRVLGEIQSTQEFLEQQIADAGG